MSSRARFQPTLPAPAMITYTTGSACRDHGLFQHVDRDGRGTDRLEALLAVPVRAPRVQDAHDHVVDAVAPARDLRHHEAGVVAVGADDEAVGLGDAGLGER